MFPNDATSWILYILLTLILGALGSGFWETVFKPVFFRIGRLLLQVVTLGMSSARDNIYRDIATRPTYKPALFFVGFVSFAFTVFLGAAAAEYQHTYFEEDEQVTSARYEAKFKQMSPQELEKEKQRLASKILELKKDLALIFLTFGLLGFVVTTLVYAKYKYVSAAIAYFDQLMAICGPYISLEDEKAFRSSFAQMTRRDDYPRIVEKLKEHATAHGVSKLPTFQIF